MSIPVYVISVLLGLWLGWVMNGWLGALILGVIVLAAGYLLNRYMANYVHPEKIQNPPLAENFFANPRWALLWLPVRIFLGFEWLEAGLHKLFLQDAKTKDILWGQLNPAWMDTGAGLLGYWKRAVTVDPATGTGPITYEWYRSFLQFLIDNNAHTWFSKLIVLGEISVGLGLIVGALVGIAAFFGILMNWSFLLAGSTSSNPLLLVMGVAVMLAWKTAGYYGVDRFLLRWLGTPWELGTVPRKVLHEPSPAGNLPSA